MADAHLMKEETAAAMWKRKTHRRRVKQGEAM